MNSNALLSEYVEKNGLVLIRSVKIAERAIDQEALHDMRVSLKKLRLAFTYADYMYPALQFNRTFLSAFRETYVVAGKIRELQLNCQLLNCICHSEMFLKQYEQICLKQIERFKEQFLLDLTNVNTSFLKRAVDELKLLKCININDHALLKTYVKKLFEEADAAIVSSDRLKVHRARKDVKMLLYVSAIFRRNYKKLAENRMTKTADLLGQWHDWVVLSEHLHEFKETVEINLLADIAIEKAQKMLTDARAEWHLYVR